MFSVNYFCRFRTGGTTWPRGPTIRSTSSTLNDLRRTALSGHRGGRFGSPLCRARAEGVGEIVRAVRAWPSPRCARQRRRGAQAGRGHTQQPRARTSPRATRRSPCQAAGRARCRPAADSFRRTCRRPRPAPPWQRPLAQVAVLDLDSEAARERAGLSVTKIPGSYTAPGASPQTGTRRYLRSAGSRTSRSSEATNCKSYANKHIPLIQKISGASPQNPLSYPERPRSGP